MTREDKRINTKKIAERRVRRDHADKILEFVATNKIKPVLKQLDTVLTGLGDKAVISLLPLALGIVADAVLVPLAPMLVLLQLGGGLGILLFQFLA